MDTGQGASRGKDRSKFVKIKGETFVLRVSEWKPHGTQQQGVQKKVDAQMELADCAGRVVSVKLTDALLIPGYPQNILSVEAAASEGARFNFEKNNNKIILPDGTTCKMKVKDRLYYLDIVTEKDQNSVDSCNVSFDLKTWHEIMGRCNYGDFVKLETVVNGMKIRDKTCKSNQCATCLQGKVSQSRNRKSDES